MPGNSPFGRRGKSDVLALVAGTQYTEAFAVPLAGCIGVLLQFTAATSGSLEATMQLQGSPLADPGLADDVDWATFLAKTPDAITSADANRGVELNFSAFLWYRFKIVTASGTGNVVQSYTAKDTK